MWFISEGVTYVPKWTTSTSTAAIRSTGFHPVTVTAVDFRWWVGTEYCKL